MKYILSTRTNTVNFCFYRDGGGTPVLKSSVHVYGGANIPGFSGDGEVSKNVGGVPLWTPQGMVTPVSDELYELLKDNYVFKTYLKDGTMKLIDKDIRGNHNEIVKETADMTKRDKDAQLTPKTYAGKVKAHTPVSHELL